MKKTLYYKFILGYILFILVSILFIEVKGTDIIENRLISNKAEDMYNQAHYLAAYPNMVTSDSIYGISYVLNADVIYLDSSNIVRYSSAYYRQIDEIPNFDITDLGSNTYTTSHFYNLYDEQMITVAMPVTENYTTCGYIVVNYPVSKLKPLLQDIMKRVYIIALAIFGFSLIILVIITFTVYFPVLKLSTAASEYAKGNLTYPGLKNFTGDDEIGRLGVSLSFMASELNTLEEDQKKFIANISHDFRSPLTSIRGYIEAMKDGTIPPEMQEKYLDIVLFESERLTKLTSSLLTLNAWDTGSNRLDLTEVNIYQLIKPILISFEGKCNRKKINLDLTVESKDYIVYADKGKIEQVVYNLLDNAIKFSHNNSTIYISVKEKNDKIFVSVKDSGIGIPKDSLSKIWDRFYKTDLSRGKDKTGSGLGLPIAKEIIQSHGENINVISTEGVGTEFIFTLTQYK